MATRARYILKQAPTFDAASSNGAVRQFRWYLHDRRFWIVQGLVILATAVHWGFELVQEQTSSEFEGLFIVAMYALYFVPVIYASLNFGREGAIPTAVWAAVLGIPSILLWHSGVHRLAESIQHLTIIGLAVVIAGRVDREVSARREAERESRARRLSEARYHGLFDAVGDAILVFDESGIIREANATAVGRFGHSPDHLIGSALGDVVGKQNAGLLIRSTRAEEGCTEDLLIPEDSGTAWLEPICSRVRTNGDQALTQVVLRDVTVDRNRRLGLEVYTRQVIQAQEEERRRIARELHDGPLQALILLHRELDDLQNQSPDLRENVQERILEVRRQVVNIVDEVRRFSRDLRPSILDDLGLVPAVRWLATDLTERSGVDVRLNTAGTSTRLSPDVELGLFRIAQEALHNIERHAQASRTWITLEYEENRVRLIVEDNGMGLGEFADPVSAAKDAGKLGLLGMQERARLLDGELLFYSSSDGGTRVQTELPTGFSSATEYGA